MRPTDAPPLYLFLHTYLVHDYFALRSWAVAQTPGHDDRNRDFYRDCLVGKLACNPGDWARLRQLYAAGLSRVDESFGRLLATLAKKGLRESSLIVLLSDHGEGFDPAHARIHHGGRLHADLIRIPARALLGAWLAIYQNTTLSELDRPLESPIPRISVQPISGPIRGRDIINQGDHDSWGTP